MTRYDDVSLNKADRIVAQREAAAAAERACEKAASAAAVRHSQETEWQKVLAAVPATLAWLDREGWRGGETIRLERKTLFGGYKPYTKAGRKICSYTYPWKDIQADAAIYLLSDGRLATSSFQGTILLEERLEFILESSGVWRYVPLDEVCRGLHNLTEGRSPDML